MNFIIHTFNIKPASADANRMRIFYLIKISDAQAASYELSNAN